MRDTGVLGVEIMAKRVAKTAQNDSVAGVLTRFRENSERVSTGSRAGQAKKLELDASKLALIADVIALNAVAAEVKAKLDKLKGDAGAHVWEALTDAFWKSRVKPENPKIAIRSADGASVDHEVTYQIQNSFDLPQLDGIPGAIAFLCDNAGLSPQAAAGLVADELVVEPKVKLRYTISELLEGHFEGSKFVAASEEEKAAAGKLVRFLDSLPESERKLLVVVENCVKVRDPAGLMSRAWTFAKSADGLRQLLKALGVRAFFSGFKFALNDGLATKQARLVKAATQLLKAKE
jgi:hypothetical protein